MPYYIVRTTKLFGSDSFNNVINDYSTKEIAEKALMEFEKMPCQSGTEWQKFFIVTNI